MLWTNCCLATSKHRLENRMNILYLSFLLLKTASGCVSSLQDLEAALESARPGERVLICDGDYEEWSIVINTSGSELAAVTPGEVSLHHSSSLAIRGSDNTVSGLVIHGGGSLTPITLTGDRNTLMDSVVEHHTADIWVMVDGVGNTIRNCRSGYNEGKPFPPVSLQDLVKTDR